MQEGPPANVRGPHNAGVADCLVRHGGPTVHAHAVLGADEIRMVGNEDARSRARGKLLEPARHGKPARFQPLPANHVGVALDANCLAREPDNLADHPLVLMETRTPLGVENLRRLDQDQGPAGQRLLPGGHAPD
jgi:hypothetical protein